MTTIEQLQLEFRGVDVSLGSVGASVLAMLKAIETQAAQTSAAIKAVLAGAGGGSAVFTIDTSGVQAAQNTIQSALRATVTATSEAKAQQLQIQKMYAAREEELARNVASAQKTYAVKAAEEANAVKASISREFATREKTLADQIAATTRAAYQQRTEAFRVAKGLEADIARNAAAQELAIQKKAESDRLAIVKAGEKAILDAKRDAANVARQEARTDASDRSAMRQGANDMAFLAGGGPLVALSRIAQGLTSVSASAFAAGAAIAVLAIGVYKMIDAAIDFGKAVATYLVSTLASAVKEGVEFNAALETGRLGIASTIITFREFAEGGKIVTDGTKAFAMAMEIAEATQDMLRAAAFKTLATFEELEKGFESMFAAAAGGKATIGEIVEFTTTVANMAAVLHVPFDQAARQMALALQGVSRSTGRIGAFLRSLHIDNATLKSWIEQGTAVQNLQKALERYGELGDVIGRTFAGRVSNLKDTWQQLSGVLAVPLFEKLNASMGKVLDLFVDLSGKTAKFRPEILNLINVIGQGVAGMFAPIAAGIEAFFSIITATLVREGVTWQDVFVELAAVVAKISATIAKSFAWLAMAISNPWGLAMDAMVAYAKYFAGAVTLIFLPLEKVALFWKGLSEGKGPKEAAKDAFSGQRFTSALIDRLDPVSSHVTSGKGAELYQQQIANIENEYSKAVEAIKKASEGGKEALKTALAAMAALRAKMFGDGGEEISKAAKAWQKFADAAAADARISETSKGPERDIQKSNEKLKADMEEANKLAEATYGKGYQLKQEYIDTIYNLTLAALDRERAAIEKAAAHETAENKARLEANVASETSYWAALAAISTTGAETRQQAIDNAYGKGMERLRVNAETAKQDLMDLASGGGINQADLEARWDAIIEAETAFTARQIEIRRSANARLSAEQSRDWEAYRRELAKHLEETKGMSPIEAQAEALRETAGLSLKTAQTMNEGIVAAWYQTQASIREQGQITADFIVDNWRTMQQSFDDILVSGIKHGWEGVLDALSAASDGYLKNFTKMVTEMVTTWIAGQSAMRQTAVTGVGGAPGGSGAMGDQTAWGAWTGIGYSGGAGGPTWSTGGDFGGDVTSGTLGSTGGFDYGGAASAGLGAAAAGFGGATGGAASFGQGFAPYLSVAATAASLGPATYGVGYIVAAVIALIGLVVNLLSPDTEQHYRVTADSLRLQSSGDLAATTSGGIIAKSMGGQVVVDYRDKLVGSMFDMFNQGAPDQAAMLSKAVNDALNKYILGINFEVHAGSDEDIQKDFEYLFTQVMPREMMAKLFGATAGPMDIAGISGGKWFDTYNLDATAPITSFLTSIGFSMAKVRELAAESQTMDAKAFLARLQDIVNIVLKAREISAQLGLSASGVYAQVVESRNTSPAQAFADQAKGLITMADQLSSFSGQERLDRAKTLLDTYEKYAAAQKAAITQLLDLAQQFADKIDALFVHMAELGKSADEQFAAAWARQQALLNPVRTGRSHGVGVSDTGEVYSVGVESGNVFKGMTTADQITKAYNEAFDDLAKIWDTLLARLTQAQSLKAAFAELTANLSMSNAAIWDAAHKNPFRVIAENVADMGEKIKWAASMDPNSQAWLDVMQDIGTQGVATFQAIAAEIANIHTAQVSMNNDIDAQILGIRRSLMGNQAQLDKWNQEIVSIQSKLMSGTATADDQARLATLQGYTAGYNPQELIDDYMRVIREDQAKLATATTPEEVARLTKEIQDQINLYLAQFNNENQTPEKRQAAAAWAEGILNSTRSSANAAYDAFNKVLTDARTTLLGMLSGIGTGLDKFIGGVQADIELVRAAFVKLKNDTVAAFGALASSITDPNAGLVAALERTSGIFTGAGGGGTGFNGAVSDATEKLGKFKDELGNVIDKLGQLDPNLTTGTQGSGMAGQFSLTPSEASQYGTAGARDAYRRAPNSFQPSVGVFG